MRSDKTTDCKKKNDKFQILWVWASLAFMISVFEPFSIFFTEKNEFWFDFYTMFPRCMGMFAVILVCGGIVLVIGKLLLRQWPGALMDGMVLGVFAALYIQGNFMSKDLPAIAGGMVEWSAYHKQTIQSNLLWIACIVLGMVAAYFLEKRILLGKVLRYVGILSMFFFVLTVTMLGIQNHGFSRNIQQISTTKSLWDYSQTENMILFVVDSVDSDVEERVLADSPEYEGAFQDFTDYTNVLSGYPYTQWSLPFMLSGDWYEYDEDFNEYVGRAYTQNPLVERLQKEGYQLDLYTNESPFRYHDIRMYENIMVENGKVRSNVGFCKLWLRLVGFKYAPYVLKRYSQIFPWEFAETGENTTEYPMVLFYESNRRFYEGIQEGNGQTPPEQEDSGKRLVPQKCFKVIHVEGAHLPMWYHADLSFDYGVTTTYYENVEACNTLLKAYIEELKRLGVYDNTILIVAADHGFNEEKGDVYYGRQHPFLMIKGLNEHHEKMQRSDAPLSHEDLGEIYQRLLDGKASDAVTDYREGDVRTRRYLWCNDTDATGLVESYTTGHARDTDMLTESGIRYP